MIVTPLLHALISWASFPSSVFSAMSICTGQPLLSPGAEIRCGEITSWSSERAVDITAAIARNRVVAMASCDANCSTLTSGWASAYDGEMTRERNDELLCAHLPSPGQAARRAARGTLPARGCQLVRANMTRRPISPVGRFSGLKCPGWVIYGNGLQIAQ